MALRRIPVVIAYDFDGTLAPGVMHDRNFFPALGMRGTKFFDKAKAIAREHDMDEILAYLQLMIEEANIRRIPITLESFIEFGRGIEFFPGVEGWFKRINEYGKKAGVKIEHYVISSGLREMIKGTSIAGNFAYIFASGFRYNHNGVAEWPALAVNYTNKTQYLFRINKGIPNSYDNSLINQYVPLEERPVPFENMIYLGDGETDIPAMKMVTHQGGAAIAVFPPYKAGARATAEELVVRERASAAVRADYSEGKALDLLVKARIDIIAAQARFRAAAGLPIKAKVEQSNQVEAGAA